jgi:hypothetical protein
MTTTPVESLPATWDDARDLPFFRITDRLFPADFCFGSSVLLASYDDDILETVDTPAATERPTGTTTAARPAVTTEPARDVVPARVRRPR